MTALGFWELYLVRTGGLLVGNIVPLAGSVGVRLAYLRHRGLAYSGFTWATLLTNTLSLLTAAGVAAGALATLWMLGGRPPAAVLALTAGVLALGVGGLIGFQLIPRLAVHPRLKRWNWVSSLGAFHTTPGDLGWVFFLASARHCLNFLTFGLLYESLSSTSAGILAGGLVYALTSPVRAIQITPGNLGVSEWIVALVGRTLSYDLTTGLLVALVFRGLTLAAQAVGALAGGAWLAMRGERR
jgi:hypothetical protein